MAHTDFDQMPPRASNPPVDRRSIRPGRRRADRNHRLRAAAAALLALCGALAVVFFVFAAIGAVDLVDAAVASVVAVVLALLWLAGLWQRARSNSEFATRDDRERRGF